MKRQLVLLISLALGLAAAVMTYVYLAAKDDEVTRLKEAINGKYKEMDALCFNHDIPSGTVITKADLGLITVPRLGLRGQALTAENVIDIVGRKTVTMHKTGDIVFWSDIEGGDQRSNGLSADIKKQMRAVSINCSGAASVSGMVMPNDHVDVIGTFDFERAAGKRDFVTCTMLQNVLVLATGSATAKSGRKGDALGQAYSTVTLEVTPREAEMLAFAEQIKGRLVLTLRNRNDISFEQELPKVDFEKIRSEIEDLNLKRQQQKLTNR